MVFVVFSRLGNARGNVGSDKRSLQITKWSLARLERSLGLVGRVFVESGGAREGAMEVPRGAPGVPKPSREASVNPADLRDGRREVARRSPGGIIRGIWALP